MFFAHDTQENTSTQDKNTYFDIIRLTSSTVTHRKKLKKKKVTFNCHSICRALAMMLGPEKVTLIDGYYVAFKVHDGENGAILKTVGQKHSWLLTTDGSIIEPYPVGAFAFMPILYVKAGPFSGFVECRYQETDDVTAFIEERETFF